MEGWTIAAVVISVVAVVIAFWQAWMSKQQLDLARETEARTEKTLDEIRRETSETRRISQDIKSNIDERITKILDSKLAAEQQSQSQSKAIGEALTAQLLGGLAQSFGMKTDGDDGGQAEGGQSA